MQRPDGSKIPKKSLRNLPPQATLPRVKISEAAQSRPRSRVSSQRGAPRARASAGQAVGTWALLVIDSQPLRKKARRDYQRAVRELDAAKADTERFYTQDKPLFSQWLSANFGALLTEMRDLQSRLFEAQNLVDEVQQEYFYGGHRSVYGAYRAVMNRRNNPEPEPEPESQHSEEPRESDHTDEDFSSAANDFWNRLHEPEIAPQRARDRAFETQRLKELYRKLARRLHPDNGRAITPHESELWLQTQTAYENGQVEVLENILNLIEIDEQGSKNASVSTLLRLTASLRATLRALKAQITGMRQNLAWNFSRRTDRDELLRRTNDSLLADREKLVWLLTKYEMQIQRWELAASDRKRRVPARDTVWTDEEWL